MSSICYSKPPPASISNDIIRESGAKRPKIMPNRKSRIKKEEIGIPICENTKEELKAADPANAPPPPVEDVPPASGNSIAIDFSSCRFACSCRALN